MDPYLAMMSMQQLPEEKLRTMARKLRGQSMDAAALATSSIPEVSQQGRDMQRGARETARDIGYQQNRGLSAAVDALTASQKGSEELGFSKMSNTATEKFENAAQDINNLLDTIDNYRPEYQSIFPTRGLGNLENALASTTGIGDEDQATWWSTLKYLYELPTRNKLFGSALTNTEQAEWNRASPSPGDTAEVTQRKLRILKKIASDKGRKMYETGKAKRMPADYLEATLGGVMERVGGRPSIGVGETIRGEFSGGGGLEGMSTEELMELYRNAN